MNRYGKIRYPDEADAQYISAIHIVNVEVEISSKGYQSRCGRNQSLSYQSVERAKYEQDWIADASIGFRPRPARQIIR